MVRTGPVIASQQIAFGRQPVAYSGFWSRTLSEWVVWIERVTFPTILRKDALDYLKSIGLTRTKDYLLVRAPLIDARVDVMRFRDAAHAAMFLLWLPSR